MALRRALAGLAFLATVLGFVPVAAADAPGPTNYQSQVLSVVPATSDIEIDIIGGDSFVRLRVKTGVEVVVIGYGGEPYLRVLPSGVVEENQLSPAKYLNEERYGDTPIPVEADEDADPEWLPVGDDGDWSWHDHRTHLMIPSPPIGAELGDQINEGVIPLMVDGVSIKVTVGTYWLAGPSRAGVIFGGLIGIGVAAPSLARRRQAGLALLAGLCGAGLFVGVVQNATLPAETGPSILNWLLPLLALGGLGVSWAWRRPLGPLFCSALALLGATELAIWGFLRSDGLVSTVLPGSGPVVLDRVTTAAALVGGSLAAAAALRGLLLPSAEDVKSLRRAHKRASD